MIEDITEFYQRLSGEKITDENILLPVIENNSKENLEEIFFPETEEDIIFPFWELIHLNFIYKDDINEPIFQVLY